ncbi:hypothetical protein EB796_013465 [Bugula neritina]|uniref:Uncharacterized protein n=1 Tax=Bugula neritina TaxID=10212 RepID=A0A7J7JPH6_BUGNE|nr:hypothetical protein EB796_013465 [Bugula neritina]
MYPDFSNFRDKLAKRSIFTAEEMCAAIFDDTRVSLLAGGVTHSDSAESLTVRLCYVNFDGEAALTASKRIGLETAIENEFVLEYCSATVEAIEELTRWCTKLQES